MDYSEDQKDINGEYLAKKLASLKRLAHWLDESIKIPGTESKIGIDGIIGLVPIIGDITTGGLSAYILYQATKFNIPKKTLLRMILNVTVDMGIGFVPILGDLFDFYWKANLANINLLISHMESEMANHEMERKFSRKSELSGSNKGIINENDRKAQ